MTSNAQKAQAIFLSAIEEHKPAEWPAFWRLPVPTMASCKLRSNGCCAHAELGTFPRRSQTTP